MVNFVRDGFFSSSLAEADPAVYSIITQELSRQQHQLELIASENIVSKAVLEAVGSILTNKYAEGYPGKRYYGGCVHVDALETLAQERATKLFQCQFANVQPHSGSSANLAVYFSLLSAGDVVLGMDLNSGGHLTHGSSVSFSGKIFHGVSYGVDPESFLIDYDVVESLAHKHRPKMIIAGWSAYSRPIDFARFRAIADSVGAFLMVDMAHFAGLVVTGLYPSPFPHAHVVTSTTHKTLRGPRGGLILTNDADIAKRVNSAIFPMTQGGPLMHVVAGKAVAFGEAMDPSYTAYMTQVVQNARVLASVLMERGLSVLTGGTDTHLLLLNLKPLGVTGLAAEHALEAAGLTSNKNSIPFDDAKPTITSGIRLGTPAITTRGFKDSECIVLAQGIADVLHSFAEHPSGDPLVLTRVRSMVMDLCQQFPIYDKVS